MCVVASTSLDGTGLDGGAGGDFDLDTGCPGGEDREEAGGRSVENRGRQSLCQPGQRRERRGEQQEERDEREGAAPDAEGVLRVTSGFPPRRRG
jgi:hypothetical protein